jgi:hypothetical protein
MKLLLPAAACNCVQILVVCLCFLAHAAAVCMQISCMRGVCALYAPRTCGAFLNGCAVVGSFEVFEPLRMTMDEEKAAAVQYDVDLTNVKVPVMQPGVPDSAEVAAEASSTAKADGAAASRSSGKPTMRFLMMSYSANFICSMLGSIERKT